MIFRQRDPSQDQDVSIQSTEDASITRNFRYMRRKPTIISYQPPPGDLDEDGNQLPQLSDIVVDSDHMILDRIQGKFIWVMSTAAINDSCIMHEKCRRRDSNGFQLK